METESDKIKSIKIRVSNKTTKHPAETIFFVNAKVLEKTHLKNYIQFLFKYLKIAS